jgi:dethiobiotin synthetase
MNRSARRHKARIVFITGTDTGVGKTVFTGLLLHHLRTSGCHALAMKPFCSGGRADVRLLRALQDAELSEAEINPFYFPEPVAPLVSSRQQHRKISLQEVVRRIRRIAQRCDTLLIEGAGGVLVPLGENYMVRDLIKRLKCEVIIVSRNRLGTINHTLLTVEALRNEGIERVQVAIVAGAKKDRSSRTNYRILSELCASVPVHAVEFLGKNANESGVLKKTFKKMKKTLARFCR